MRYALAGIVVLVLLEVALTNATFGLVFFSALGALCVALLVEWVIRRSPGSSERA